MAVRTSHRFFQIWVSESDNRRSKEGIKVKRIVCLVAAVTALVSAVAAALWLAVPAGAAPAARSTVTGTEHFQLMTTSSTATKIRIIAYGVFTAAGVDHTGSTVDKIVFANGSFKINHAGVPVKETFNKKTCLLQVSGSGKVTLFAGTGAYKGISGKPVATLSILAIAARTSTGKCSMTKAPVAFQQIIKASGKITL
jgi:hypothetical protein